MAKITFVADGIDQGKLWRGDGGAGGALDGDQGVSQVGESKEVEGERKESEHKEKYSACKMRDKGKRKREKLILFGYC